MMSEYDSKSLAKEARAAARGGSKLSACPCCKPHAVSGVSWVLLVGESMVSLRVKWTDTCKTDHTTREMSANHLL